MNTAIDPAIRASIAFQSPDLFGLESPAPISKTPAVELIQTLKDRGWDQKQIATAIGRNSSQITRALKKGASYEMDEAPYQRLVELVHAAPAGETAERSDAISAKLDMPETIAAPTEDPAPAVEPIEARGADATAEPSSEQAESKPAPRANLDGFEVQAPKAPRIDIKDTAARALAAAEAICRHWLPEGKRQGHEWVSTNPTRADKTPGSFSVNLDTGKWADFATDDKGGDLVSLVAYLENADSQVEAARTLAEWLGCAPVAETMPKPAKAAPRPMKARPLAHPKLGVPSAQWDYRDAEGRVLCAVMRFETATGKEFRPITQTPDGWLWQAPAEPRPLYGLDRLAARMDAPVILAEGEKAADAAGVLLPDCVHIASMNGAQSPKKSDWTPLKGRVVRIWPDADRPGNDFAQTAAALILEAGAQSVEVLDLSSLGDGLPEGWDAADALADGWTPERFAECARFVDADAQDAPPAPVFPPASDRPRYVVLDDWAKYKGKKQQPGVYWCTTKERPDGDLDLIEDWVCTPLHVDAITFDEQQDNFGRLLRFKNTLGKWREWAMPMEMLAGKGDELRARLLNMGVEFHPYHGRRELPIYLQGEHPKRRMHCATQTGWVGECFVLPDVVIGPTSAGVIFQSAERITNEYTVKGTLAGWQSEIAARAVGNPLLLTALSASFAGPLMGRCIIEGGGVHFYGPSSCGKTTLVVAACSTWGGSGYKRSWKGTANGQEGVAALFNDNLLALDEISEADPREVGAIVYQLGNGTGKQRAGRSGHARPVVRWRCVILSSGERTVATTMLEGGQRAKAGQSVRLLDVPVARRYGTWDTLHDLPTGERFSDAIKRAAETHHGHAGRAFLDRLTRDKSDFSLMLEKIKAMPLFAAEGEEGQDKRAAARFALIGMAGELATEYGITQWPQGEALKAAAECFRLWQAERGTGNDERRQILERVARFIDRHGDSRFSDADAHDSSRVYDRAGWWKDGPGGRQYLFNADGMRDALAGFDFRRALDVLQEVGALPAPSANGERARLHRIDGRAIKLYPIVADKLTGGEHGA